MDGAAESSGSGAAVAVVSGRAWILAGLLAMLLCGAAVLTYQIQYPTLSPVDEFQHLDVAERIASGGLVGRGDRFSVATMRELVCRRIDATELRFGLPPCTTPDRGLDPRVMPEYGYNSAYIHPPTYYAVAAVTGMLARGLDRSFAAGARLGNLLWLALFVVALGAVMRWSGLDPPMYVATAVVLVVNPGSLGALGTVNPDAAGLAAGACCLAAYLGFRRSGRWLWLLPAVVPVLVKSTHAAASVVVVGLLLVDAATGWAAVGRAERRRRLQPAVAVAGGVVLGAVAVLGLQRALVRGPASLIDQLRRFRVEQFPFDQLTANILVVPPLPGYTPAGLRWTPVAAVVAVATLAVLLGLVGALADRADLGDGVVDVRRVAAVTLAVAVLAGPGLVVVNYVLSHIYVGIPARYLISLLPGLALGAAWWCQRRRVTRLAWISLAAALWIVVMVAMTRVATIGVVAA